MTYSNTDAEDATDALSGDSEEQGENSQQTFYLPSDFLNGKKYKAGDSITLKVMGEDEDGDTEVTLAMDGGDESDWRNDLKQSMADQGSGPQEQA